jgi:tRNA (Thr-GGU) A37 N-methylase
MREITLRPIGVIHSPHTIAEKTPIQPSFATGIPGTVEIQAAYAEGLADLDGFSHIWLVYLFDRTGEPRPAARRARQVRRRADDPREPPTLGAGGPPLRQCRGENVGCGLPHQPR